MRSPIFFLPHLSSPPPSLLSPPPPSLTKLTWPQINMSNARNQRTCHRLLPAASAENKLPAPALPRHQSDPSDAHLISPCRFAARQGTRAAGGRGRGRREREAKERNNRAMDEVSPSQPPSSSPPTPPPLVPPLFPTRGLRLVTGQRGGNYPATVLYLLRRRRDCVPLPPHHVCSPLPPPPLFPASHRSGPRAIRDSA